MKEKFSIESIAKDIANRFPESIRENLSAKLTLLLLEMYKVETGRLKGVFEPVQLSEHLIQTFRILSENKIQPAKAKEYWLEQKFNERQLSVFLPALINFVSEHFKEDKSIGIAKIFLETEYEILCDTIRNKKLSKTKSASKLSVKQVALIAIYEGSKITRKNCIEVAKKFNVGAGEKLYQHYSRFSSKQNRIGLEGSSTKNKNKLQLLEDVIKHLKTESALKMAKDEYIILTRAIKVIND